MNRLKKYKKIRIRKIDRVNTYEKIWIKIVAIALGLMGIINIISAWFNYDVIRFKFINNFFDYHIINGSRYLIIMTGIIAIIIAPNLYRQKKTAWYISVALLLLSIGAHVINGSNIIECSPSLLLLGILIPLYKYCNVKSDPIRIQHGGKILLGAIALVIVYTLIGIHFFADQLGLPHNISIFRAAFNAFFFDVYKFAPQNMQAKFFINSISVVGLFSMLIGLTLALSPVIVRTFPEINLEKYKRTAKKYAIQPIQILTLVNNYIHFSHENDPKGYVSYKVSDGVAMMVGNPCTKASLEELTDKWINFARNHDWIPATFQAQGQFLEILKNRGFYSIPIGVEALVDLDEFTLEGKNYQDLRSARNRAERENWVIRGFKPSDWEKISSLDKKWLKIHGGKEIDFAMRKSTLKYLSETKTTLLFDKEDNLIAYLNNIEISGNNSRAVDLMRRDPETNYKGVMELLFLNEIIKAKEEGKKYYNLGLSPLAQMDKSLADNKVAFKLLKFIYEKQHNYYDFQGLYNFKSKFNPILRQSYLAYPSQFYLPKVLLALLNIFIK